MFKLAINRPITTLMFFSALIIFGLISAFIMPINLYPNVSIPLIKISSTANGDINFIESKITKEVENALAELDGVKTINSASYDNFSVSVVEFVLDKDLEIAANDVRDKLSAVSLPVKPKIEKIASDGGAVLSLFLYSKDKETLMKSIDERLKPFIQRINGVGKISSIGFLKPQIRIELNPALLEKYHLNALEVAKIIQASNFKSALGELENSEQNYILKGYFEAQNLNELKNLRLMSGVFLSDVATITQGFEDEKQAAFYQNEGVLLEIGKVSGSNALSVIKNVKNELLNLQKLAGKDIQISLVYDKSENIKKHLFQVLEDLLLGIVLTVIIVFLFLRNLSATLIASLAIPTSIIATFFLIHLLGYDLNRLSFIALTLSIGIFVDDAIVVIENIAKKMNEMPALEAAFLGIKEIGFSVLSISAVLLCVFIPISYMNSVPGLFFNALGISVASGVVVSFLVAVFLIPSMSARFFNPAKNSFYIKTEPFYEKLESSYQNLLAKILNNKAKFILFSFALIAFCFFLATRLGLDFLPMEDDSEFQVLLENKEDLSLEAMKSKSLRILEQIKSDERVAYAYLLVGYTDAKEAKKAKIYVKLKPLNKRDKRQPEIVKEYLKKDFAKEDESLKSLKINFLELPKFEGAGIDEPVQFLVLGDDLNALLKASERAKKVLASKEQISGIDDNGHSKKAEISIFIDKEKAKRLKVNAEYVAGVLAYSFGSQSVGTMDLGQSNEDIILSLDKDFKQDIEALKRIQIKNEDGLSLDLSAVVSFVASENLAVINRYNKARAIKITANNGSLSLGEVQNLLLKNLPEILTSSDLNYAFSGFINLLKETVNGFLMSVLLAFLLIYLILAALYESLILPFIIMLTMPLAFAGACFGLFITGNNFSLFVLVALILLFGMVGKNAILLVDVANKRCNEGLSVNEALIEAANSRLRAILMTTFAMIFAMLPLALSRGSGFEGNSPMAVAVIFGLISSTALTLLVVPALFGFAYKLDSRLRKIYTRKGI